MKFEDFLKSIRAINCALASAGVFVGHSVANGSIILSEELFLGMFVAFSITAAGNLINDYFDYAIDRKMGKQNPLINEEKDRQKILRFSIILFAVGLWGSSLLNSEAFGLSALAVIVLLLYSSVMRELKYVGNLFVALGTSLTLVFGASIIGNYELIVYFAVSAFFANWAREIIKDAEDISGDEGVKKTLPMIMSTSKIKFTVITLYSLAIGIALSAWGLGLITGPYYILIILISAALFFVSWDFLNKKKLWKAQQYSKHAMMTALIAFLAAAI